MMSLRETATVLLAFVALSAMSACRHDPRRELVIEGSETYWIFDASAGETKYLAPAVKFVVRNSSRSPRYSVEAQAVFRRQGETEQWGGAWQAVTEPGKPLAPGESTEVVLRSDGRYSYQGPADAIFANPGFKDATVQLLLRIGASPWVEFLTRPVERRIGSRAAQVDGP